MTHPHPRVRHFVVVGGLFGGLACNQSGPADAGDRPETNVPARADVLPSDPQARARAELDEQVWASEVQAQQYEGAFVDLWDRMRAAKDPARVLAAFEFDEIVVPTGLPEFGDLGGGVRLGTTGSETHSLDSAGWKTLIESLRAAEWELVQSEWHHSRFIPGEPAKSMVSFVLHAKKGAEGGKETRAAVTGELGVTWAGTPAADGSYRPVQIDASELKITMSEGRVGFSKAASLDPRAKGDGRDPHVQPILVHDLDGDGRSDIVLAGANAVYWNRGGMNFERDQMLARPPGYIAGAAIGDFDGDAKDDLLVATSGGPIVTYSGDRHGKFAGKPREVALGEPLMNPLGVTLGDVDADGDVDVFVSQYKRPYVMGQMPTPYYDANDGFPAYLLVNDGNGGFTDGTEASGLGPKRKRRTYAAGLVDIDDDGDLDLLVVSDFSGLDIHRNDGKGRFSDVTSELVDERASFGMSFTMGDYDLDGHDDLYVVGMSSTTARRLEQLELGRDEFETHQDMRMKMAYGNRMYAGGQGGVFRQAAFADLVARTGWSWGSTSFDYDLDGDLDLYVGNGFLSRKSARDYCTTFWRHDIYTGTSETDPKLDGFFKDEFQRAITEGVSWNGFEHNKLFRNTTIAGAPGANPRPAGEAGFVEVGWAAGVALEEDSRAVVSDDLDLDGRPDLIVALSRARAGEVRGEALEERVIILKNEVADEPRWIGVRLGRGRRTEGAVVEVRTNLRTHRRKRIVGDSLQSQHAPAWVFGLAPQETVEAIEVTWPDGSRKNIKRPSPQSQHVLD